MIYWTCISKHGIWMGTTPCICYQHLSHIYGHIISHNIISHNIWIQIHTHTHIYIYILHTHIYIYICIYVYIYILYGGFRKWGYPPCSFQLDLFFHIPRRTPQAPGARSLQHSAPPSGSRPLGWPPCPGVAGISSQSMLWNTNQQGPIGKP